MTKYLRNKIIKNAICWPLIGAGIAGIVIGNFFANYYDKQITAFLCPSIVDEADIEESSNEGNELAIQIEEEGMALVQNRGGQNGRGVLPLDSSVNKVNVFGRGGVEWHFGGTGSGGISTSNLETLNLVQALEAEGISVNTELVNASKNVNEFVWDYNNLSTSTKTTSRTFEPNISEYQQAYNNAKSYSDTAIVAFGRYAGEGNDLAKTQYKLGKYGNDTTRTTLDFSTQEEALLRQVAQDFDKVIVVINSTNTMNLEYVESIDGVDACLVVGTTGCVGARAIKKVMWGDVTPSGHLTDTYVYDFKSCPNYFNSGYDYFGVYTGSGQNNGAYAECTYRSAKSDYRGRDNACYVDYDDGIYVGYRWYETADAEGFWDGVNNDHGVGYDGIVQYPFGYGLSYVSNFEWELVTDKCSPAAGSTIDENTDIELTVKVTNKDAVYSGKDVVQVYLTAPYDEDNPSIEKSYVSLVGYAKTPVLGPNQSCELPIKMSSWDFKSFDDIDQNENGHKGYELEAGDYVLRFRTDAHHDKVMDGGNTVTYTVSDTIKIENDKDTGAPIKPVLSGNNSADGFSIDGSDTNQNINYLTRKMIKDGTYSLPTEKPADRAWNTALEVSKGGTSAQSESHMVGNVMFNFYRWNTYSKELARAWDNATGVDAFGNPIPTEKPSFGVGNYVELVKNFQLTEAGEKCAADYDDPLWEQVLGAVKYEDATKIISESYPYSRPSMPYIGINQGLKDHDGPSQINTYSKWLTGYPCPTVVGQSFDEKLAFKFGKSYGNDMRAVGADGAYAFACNIHRTPFGGRNYEYISEDPYLSGKQVSQACRGVQIAGKTTYLKHFVCNDQETWRCGLYTWLTEQSFREIYAKPFEFAVKADTTTGIMSAFNRVGSTWVGGSEGANQGILRNEWGFHGIIKTDYGEDCDVMDFAQCVRAGETMGLADSYGKSADGTVPSLSKTTARFATRVREIVHETVWSYIHGLYLNKTYNASDEAEDIIVAIPSKESWVWWRPVVYGVESLMVCGMAIGGYFLVRPLDEESKKKPSKKEAR